MEETDTQVSGFKVFLLFVEFLHKFGATGTEKILTNTGTYMPVSTQTYDALFWNRVNFP
jgi:hypothetical protein